MSGEAEPLPLSSSAPVSSEPTPSPVGRLLAGRYRLQGVLGEGGMAIVYEGEHIAIGKRVAIKLVQSVFAKDDEIVSRFEREARSASAVESEHIVHVFDVGADPELGLFLVMELLKGQDLGHVLARRGRLDPVFACGLVKQAALGLEKAHAAGIVHRDLKPANVFLVTRDDGTTLVKLVDFGIAKVLREAHDARFSKKGITRRGTAIGTPQYMSPEQAQGLDTVDQRTDVYSLGAVLFEAIAGRPYMEERATYEQTILQLISTPAPRLSTVVPDIPRALDDLIADMLEHDLARRVPDMRTVRERIAAAYPELQGPTVTLKSLPPLSASSLERYVVRGDGDSQPHGETVREGGAIPLLRRRRARARATVIVAWVAVAAAALGIGIGALALRRSSAAIGVTRMPPGIAPAMPGSAAAGATAGGTPGGPASASSLGAASPAASPAAALSPLPPAVSSASAAGGAAGSGPAGVAGVQSPGGGSPPPHGPGGPPRKPAPSAPKPGDQVGAAGISSQF